LRWLAAAANYDDSDDEREYIDQDIQDFLAGENISLNDASMSRFRPEFIKARHDAYADLTRNARGDYSPSVAAARYPEPSAISLDFIAAFERYAEQGGVKGGEHGPPPSAGDRRSRRFATGPATAIWRASPPIRRSIGWTTFSSKRSSLQNPSATSGSRV
jgi:hypothetical protein